MNRKKKRHTHAQTNRNVNIMMKIHHSLENAIKRRRQRKRSGKEGANQPKKKHHGLTTIDDTLAQISALIKIIIISKFTHCKLLTLSIRRFPIVSSLFNGHSRISQYSGSSGGGESCKEIAKREKEKEKVSVTKGLRANGRQAKQAKLNAIESK